MKEKLGATIGFRPRIKHQERLEYAEKLGFSKSELINKLLDEHLVKLLETEVKAKKLQLRALLEAPMP